MLRIAKTSPGVLDLSAVKDESGLPVILNGPSHRDVPDHEEENPVLQRVVAVQWVTLTRLPVDAPVDDQAFSNGPEASEVLELPPETAEGSPPSATDHVDDASASPSSDDNAAVDVSAKPEGSNKPPGKPDTRRAGRRP